jgi:hypothetical protein
MAAPVAQAKGVYAVGTTSFVADVPAGIALNDILLIIMESSDSSTAAGTPTTPADWTKLFERSQSTAATTTLTIFGKVATGSETDVTVDGVLNHCSGTMFAVRGAKASVAGASLKVGTGNGADTGNMASVAGITVDEADCLGLLVGGSGRDAINTTNWSVWASVNGTSETEWEDNHTNTAAGGGIGVAWFLAPSSGSTGDGSATIAVSVPWNGVQLVFEPKEPGSATQALTLTLTTAGDSVAGVTQIPILGMAPHVPEGWIFENPQGWTERL